MNNTVVYGLSASYEEFSEFVSALSGGSDSELSEDEWSALLLLLS